MKTGDVVTQARHLCLNYLSSAARHVDILSPALEPTLLDDCDVAALLTALARRGRQTRIRLIVSEVRPLIESGHRLISLSRRLSSAMTIRVLDEHPEWREQTLILCDRRQGLRLMREERRWEPALGAVESRRESERFDRLWRASEASSELRQF